MQKLYRHFNNFPLDKWRWPNFSPRELASRREGELMIDEDSLDKLQALRTKLNRPFIINSAYRSQAHNRAVGGATHSMHLQGKAFDISMSNHEPEAFERAAREVGFTGFGYYPKQGFMHIDTGPARVWGTPFPATATGLAAGPVIPASGVTSPDGAAAVGAGAAGAVAIGLEHLPVAGSILGTLAPTAQLIAVCAALALLAWVVWRRR